MIEKIDGFLYRSLTLNKESDTWFDMVYWGSAEAVKLGGELFMQSEVDGNCRKRIDDYAVRGVFFTCLNILKLKIVSKAFKIAQVYFFLFNLLINKLKRNAKTKSR